MNIAVILAGGRSTRMGADKLSLKAAGEPLLDYTAEKFKKCRLIDRVIIARGGATRQKTLEKTIKKLTGNPLIIIHNSANPLVTDKEIRECIHAAKKYSAAYVGRKITDTVHDQKSGETLARENLISAQTPQAAYLRDLKKALVLGTECTDEVQLLSRIGIKAHFVPASKHNFKITTWADFEYFKYLIGEKISGIGEDAHNFSRMQKGLYLGGVFLPKEASTEADSDGDVILHALINALRSAAGQKSLGSFADKMRRSGIKDSKKYLAKVLYDIRKKGLKITSVSLSIEAGRPKIDPISAKIRKNLQRLTGCRHIGITALTGNRPSRRIKCTALVNLTNED